MNVRRSINAIETTSKRLRRDLMLKRERKSKLRIILLQTKRR